MTNQEMYEYVILKWRYIVNNNGSDDGLKEAHPEMKNFRSNCSYCEKYLEKGCVDCSLNTKNKDYTFISASACMEEDHPFYAWFYNRNITNAQKVLNLIRKTKPKGC
jgi:hypothetical protein